MNWMDYICSKLGQPTRILEGTEKRVHAKAIWWQDGDRTTCLSIDTDQHDQMALTLRHRSSRIHVERDTSMSDEEMIAMMKLVGIG